MLTIIFAIDPGNIRSALVGLLQIPQDDPDYLSPQLGTFRLENNDSILKYIYDNVCSCDELVIEMVACYGMPVGETVFETVRWIGRFEEAAIRTGAAVTRIKRIDVKQHMCHCTNAKDSNIIQALRDRFGDKGTKKNPGWFYGFSKDLWQAYALAVTYADNSKRYLAC